MQSIYFSMLQQVFSLVNLSCRETMSMLKLVSDMLVAGAYVVFAYTGHGCNVGNTDYIVPVDAHDPVNPNECVASSTISEYLQSKLCRVFMIMNCCRTKYVCLQIHLRIPLQLYGHWLHKTHLNAHLSLLRAI